MDITGKKLFVKALLEEGVDTVFAYPGGTVTDLFDELYLMGNGKIDLVLPRHEQALVHEAEGYAREHRKNRRMPGNKRSWCDKHRDSHCRCFL